MAIRYYDDILAEKLKRWLPETSNLRILKPDETKRLFETMADDKNDKPFKLPFIALSRSNDFEIETTIKTLRSYSGITLTNSPDISTHFNALPIHLSYTLDIYTKTADEGDEYLRSFLFKLINNPKMVITIPYIDCNVDHVVYLRVQSTISDTSAISERLYSGQFNRWSINIDLEDAYLFNVPYRKNWKLDGADIALEVANQQDIDINIENADVTAEPVTGIYDLDKK